ncbi:MAG: hypothetical protein K9J85_02045 [Desulfobacteraceae bacterium]|nr:hypothetical protein [Desulfobacteraceae bacterium]
MEILFFLLVLIIIIVSNIARMQKKQKNAAAQQNQQETTEEIRETGWKKNLRDLFVEMQGGIQGDPQQKRRSASREGRFAGWEDLLSSKDSAGKEPETAADHDKPGPAARPEPGFQRHRSRTLIESRSREGWTPEARMGKTQRPIPAPPLAGMAGDVRRKARSLQISKKELRKAVIWYEVLGPPMSLRDPEREMWL